ncbi:35008_t:CDS:2, partial [Racocetra persica]
DKGIISRSSGSLRRSWSAIRKQKRDIEQMVTLNEAYSIIHLCAGEVLSRGLGEDNLFSPVDNEDNPDEVRYLINCLLRENHTEFEDELKFQDIRNIVSGIRWTLRRCVTSIVTYKNYENFVRLESELQYDARKGIFNQFLSNLSKPSQAILLELFELFSQVMTQAHINKIPAQRVLKSMAHYIIGDKELKFENFSAAYTKWLRCSNACTHLFLAYLRERACSASLPPRLNILLDGYVQFRKKSRSSPDYHHPLADITIEDLQLIIRPKKQRQKNNVIPRQIDSIRNSGLSRQFDPTKNNNDPTKINNGVSRRSGSLTIAEMFPDIAESLDSLRRKTTYQNLENIIEDSQTAAQKWDELQIKGFNVLSEEALKLFFAYDDRSSNPCASIVRRRSRKFNKKNFDQRFLEILPNIEIDSETLRDSFFQSGGNNSKVSLRATVVWDEFEKKGFRDSVDTNSNALSLCSTLGPSTTSVPISEVTETEVTNFEVNEINEINQPLSQNNEEIQIRTQERSLPINRRTKRKNKPFRKTFCFLCVRPGSSFSGFSVTMETDEDQDVTKDNFMDSHVTIEPINNSFPYMWVESSANERNKKEPWEWVFVEPRDERHETEWIMFEDKKRFFSEREKEKRRTRKRSLLNALNTINANMPWSKSNRRNRPNKFINKIKTSIQQTRSSPTRIPPESELELRNSKENGEGSGSSLISHGYDNLSVSSLAYNQDQYNEQSYVLASRRILQPQQSNYHMLTEGPSYSSYQMPIIQSKKQEMNREIIKF